MESSFSDIVFDPQAMSVSATESLSGLLYKFGEKLKKDFECCTPAIVEEYDATQGMALVRPLVMEVDSSNRAHKPLAFAVTVLQHQSGGFFVHRPLFKGDTGWLIASDRNSDNVKENNNFVQGPNSGIGEYDKNNKGVPISNKGPQRPACDVLHSYSQGFFIPDKWGGVVLPKAYRDAFVIQQENSDETSFGRFVLTKDGEIHLMSTRWIDKENAEKGGRVVVNLAWGKEGPQPGKIQWDDGDFRVVAKSSLMGDVSITDWIDAEKKRHGGNLSVKYNSEVGGNSTIHGDEAIDGKLGVKGRITANGGIVAEVDGKAAIIDPKNDLGKTNAKFREMRVLVADEKRTNNGRKYYVKKVRVLADEPEIVENIKFCECKDEDGGEDEGGGVYNLPFFVRRFNPGSIGGRLQIFLPEKSLKFNDQWVSFVSGISRQANNWCLFNDITFERCDVYCYVTNHGTEDDPKYYGHFQTGEEPEVGEDNCVLSFQVCSVDPSSNVGLGGELYRGITQIAAGAIILQSAEEDDTKSPFKLEITEAEEPKQGNVVKIVYNKFYYNGELIAIDDYEVPSKSSTVYLVYGKGEASASGSGSEGNSVSGSDANSNHWFISNVKPDGTNVKSSYYRILYEFTWKEEYLDNVTDWRTTFLDLSPVSVPKPFACQIKKTSDGKDEFAFYLPEDCTAHVGGSSVELSTNLKKVDSEDDWYYSDSSGEGSEVYCYIGKGYFSSASESDLNVYFLSLGVEPLAVGSFVDSLGGSETHTPIAQKIIASFPVCEISEDGSIKQYAYGEAFFDDIVEAPKQLLDPQIESYSFSGGELEAAIRIVEKIYWRGTEINVEENGISLTEESTLIQLQVYRKGKEWKTQIVHPSQGAETSVDESYTYKLYELNRDGTIRVDYRTTFLELGGNQDNSIVAPFDLSGKESTQNEGEPGKSVSYTINNPSFYWQGEKVEVEVSGIENVANQIVYLVIEKSSSGWNYDIKVGEGGGEGEEGGEGQSTAKNFKYALYKFDKDGDVELDYRHTFLELSPEPKVDDTSIGFKKEGEGESEKETSELSIIGWWNQQDEADALAQMMFKEEGSTGEDSDIALVGRKGGTGGELVYIPIGSATMPTGGGGGGGGDVEVDDVSIDWLTETTTSTGSSGEDVTETTEKLQIKGWSGPDAQAAEENITLADIIIKEKKEEPDGGGEGDAEPEGETHTSWEVVVRKPEDGSLAYLVLGSKELGGSTGPTGPMGPTGPAGEGWTGWTGPTGPMVSISSTSNGIRFSGNGTADLTVTEEENQSGITVNAGANASATIKQKTITNANNFIFVTENNNQIQIGWTGGGSTGAGYNGDMYVNPEISWNADGSHTIVLKAYAATVTNGLITSIASTPTTRSIIPTVPHSKTVAQSS